MKKKTRDEEKKREISEKGGERDEKEKNKRGLQFGCEDSSCGMSRTEEAAITVDILCTNNKNNEKTTKTGRKRQSEGERR